MALTILEPHFYDLDPIEVAAIRIFQRMDQKTRTAGATRSWCQIRTHRDTRCVGLFQPTRILGHVRRIVPTRKQTDCNPSTGGRERFLALERIEDCLTCVL